MDAQDQDLVTDGRFNFGRFERPFRRINPLDARIVERFSLPRAVKAFRLKEWQAFQMANDRFFLNVALFNAKALALVQVKVFDRLTRTKHLFEKKVTPWAFTGPEQLFDSEMAWRGKDAVVVFRNQLARDRIRVHLDVPASDHAPRLYGDIVARSLGQTPLVVAIPFGDNHGMTSHKGLMPADGELQIGDTTTTFGPGNGYVLMDDHRGFYPFVMKWDWLTSATWRPDGTLIGFNLTHNQSIDPERFHENALWINGRIHTLPPVTFERRGKGTDERWRITDRHGRVDLTFAVEVPGAVDINAVVIRSKYKGPFGTISGALVDDDGQRHAVDDWFGMGEDFYLRC